MKKIFPVETTKSGNGQKLIDMKLTVYCCIWLPISRLMITMSDGQVFEYNIDTKHTKFVGYFIDPGSRGTGSTIIIPTVITLTAQYMIVGTTNGSVYWYQMSSLLIDCGPSVTESMRIPLREMKLLHQRITSIIVDPTFSLLIIGTKEGEVVKVAIESDTMNDVNDMNNHNNNNNNNKAENLDESVENTTKKVNKKNLFYFILFY
jgi:hypothetical protein